LQFWAPRVEATSARVRRDAAIQRVCMAASLEDWVCALKYNNELVGLDPS
jgi:hypothetical protein